MLAIKTGVLALFAGRCSAARQMNERSFKRMLIRKSVLLYILQSIVLRLLIVFLYKAKGVESQTNTSEEQHLGFPGLVSSSSHPLNWGRESSSKHPLFQPDGALNDMTQKIVKSEVST